MDEKVLVKSERYNIKKGLLIFFVILAGVLLGSSVFIDQEEWYLCVFSIVGVVAVLCLIIYAWMRCFEIVITDKRIYGKTAFGTRVDLPIDSVSSIVTAWPNGVSVATSSGRVAFLMIKNRNEIHKCMSDLLVARQNKTTIKQESSLSNADELKKYKELLDSGVITQEEFDAKKKQLLGV